MNLPIFRLICHQTTLWVITFIKRLQIVSLTYKPRQFSAINIYVYGGEHVPE